MNATRRLLWLLAFAAFAGCAPAQRLKSAPEFSPSEKAEYPLLGTWHGFFNGRDAGLADVRLEVIVLLTRGDPLLERCHCALLSGDYVVEMETDPVNSLLAVFWPTQHDEFILKRTVGSDGAVSFQGRSVGPGSQYKLRMEGYDLCDIALVPEREKLNLQFRRIGEPASAQWRIVLDRNEEKGTR
ncbi:MAG TPA: hypothetical protein VFE47_05340 [Tepidisphaeraceae bacterium]|jgi:hypothetical protein|nr:hypothetical protein [Tepidisphaeraceae bacterium]